MAQTANLQNPNLAALRLALMAFAKREVQKLRLGLARREAYRGAYCALQSMSDAELATNGLSRCDVQKTAHSRAMAVNLI